VKTEKLVIIVKDVLLFTGGLAGIAYQQFTGKVDALLLLVFTAMIGLPGAAALWALRNTATQSSPSQPSEPQQGSSHSSPRSSEVGGDTTQDLHRK